MPTTVEILPFATAPGANVESQADYAAAPTTSAGFSAGLASSAKFNKAMRQASFVAAALANWVSIQGSTSVLDDGDLTGLTSKITDALVAFGGTQDYISAAAVAANYAPLSAFANSLATSGYAKFAGGLILQWSFSTLLPNQAVSTVTFPIQFPVAPLAMFASAGNLITLGTNQVGVGAGAISTSQGQIAIAANSSGATGVFWFVLGK